MDDYSTSSLDWPFDIKVVPANKFPRQDNFTNTRRARVCGYDWRLFAVARYVPTVSPSFLRSTPESFAVILVPLPPSYSPMNQEEPLGPPSRLRLRRKCL